MKIILKEDVKNLGNRDELVEVKDGYARNYLIPKGLAMEANAGNIGDMKSRRKAEERRKEKENEKAEQIASKLENISLEIKVKAGESGKLFGSITSMDISDALMKQHSIDVDKKKIELDEPIKSLGEAVVDIRLYPGVSASLKVNVTGE